MKDIVAYYTIMQQQNGGLPKSENQEALGQGLGRQESVDTKIRDLEEKLEEQKALKEGVSRKKEIEKQELAERDKIRERYKALVRDQVASDEKASGTPQIVNLSRTTAAQLLALDPYVAVHSLIEMSLDGSKGFEKALNLARSASKQPGGAWILDQFHATLTAGQKRDNER